MILNEEEIKIMFRDNLLNVNEVSELFNVITSKRKAIESQSYELAANLRDKEKKMYSDNPNLKIFYDVNHNEILKVLRDIKINILTD